ncbi:hypothetical protein ACG2OD_11390 [Streptomyces sp. PDY-4]|uniref:hypothetical protein n=1 Tax=Streptomyces sp. PDY-4 TaxID=3376070 RepID=UPI0037A6E3E6
MSRWSSVLPGRGRRSGPGAGRGPGSPAAGNGGGSGSAGGGAGGAGGGPPVEDVDGVLLVRSVEDDSFPLEVLAEVAGAVGREEDVVTVIVGSADGGGAPGADHWARLGALLDSLRARGTGRIRLVMSGAGDDRPDRPCVARRIADAWELEVTAPDGAVLITPGGALFVHGDSRPGCGWWRFAPGAEPRRLGRRAPAPDWEEALDGVPVRTSGGCVVERVPAGVLIRPAEAPGPAPDDLCFSVPVDFERLTVLVGAPHAEDVAADEVAAVLAGLPAAERSRARLAPGGRRDLLRLGQSVADRLGTEVEVLTGLPLLDDHAPPGTAARPTLVGRDGRPSWRPFVSAVVCGPVDAEGRAPVPRPVGLHPPDWILGGSERGTVRLTDRWQASVTRAGLALWAPDGPRPGPLGPAVDPEVCAIELGMPGQPLDGSLLPALSRLLRGLGTDVRSRTTLLVRGRLLTGDGALRRLAAEHGIPGIRYVTAGRPAVTAGRPGPAAALPAGAAARRSGGGGDPVTVGSGEAAQTHGHAERVATGGADEPGVEPGQAGASGVAAPSSGMAAGTSGRGVAPGPGTAAAPPAGPRPSGGDPARRAAAGGAGASGGGAARRPGAASDGPHAIEPGRGSSPGAVARESGTAAAAPSVEPRGGVGGGRGAAGSGQTAPSHRAGSGAEAPASAAAPDGGPAELPVQLGDSAEESTEAAGSSAAGPRETVSSPAEGADGAAGRPGVPGAAGEGKLAEADPAVASPDVVQGARPRLASADGSRAGADSERERAVGVGVPPDVVREGPQGAEARSGAAPAAGARAGDDSGVAVGAGGGGAPDVVEEGPVGAGARSGVASVVGVRAGGDGGVAVGAGGERAGGVGVSPDVVSEGPHVPVAGGAVVRAGTAPAAGARAGGDGGAAVGAGGERAAGAGGAPDVVEEGPVGDGARSGVASAVGVRAGGDGGVSSDVVSEGPQGSVAGGAVVRAGTASVAGVRATGWGRGRAALPFVPGHVSGVAERAAFRDAAAGAWEGHAAAVSRVLTRMPALRGHELEAARTDLVAAHAYLTADEGPLHHRELTRDLRAGEGRLLPYAGCLASALRRLPSYRGVALRGGDADGPEPPVGALLQDPAPVSALAGTSAVPAGAGVRYAIWSVTGRKVRQLLDRPGGDPESYEEIVFVPGTGFRVLAVRTVPAGPSVVLLRELPGNATAYMDGSEELSGLDLKALAHLEEALAKGFRAGGSTEWPERCSGPVGQDG